MWDCAVRLSPTADLTTVLAQAAAALMEQSSRWDCVIRVTIEPDGDACETGHFVDIEVEGSAVWAELSPWPSRFGGAIPHQLDVELELAGWVLQREGADPDPIDCLCKMPELWTEEQAVSAMLPSRRLVAFADTDELRSWASRVVHAIDRVLAPRSRRWFLSGQADAIAGGALADHPRNRSGEFFGRFTVDMGELLVSSEWERAVWPAGSESAFVVCQMGLHQYHERPCPLPPVCDPGPWGGDFGEGDPW